MEWRPKIVRGGTNEHKTCDCTKGGGLTGKIPCMCTNQKYFPGNVPERWICDDCAKGKHQWY